jgi:hypothetical protein
MSRENGAILTRANGLLIRNQSNLGPLATPNTPNNASLFGDREITQLEIDCAAHWKALLEHGAKGYCIISLGDVLAHAKYSAADTIQRLDTLQANIARYSAQVEVVDVGPPSDNNIDIYGTDCCLKSEKFMLSNKSYSRLRVVRDIDEIRDAIDNFDKKFLALKRSNLSSASKLFGQAPRNEDKKRALLHRYIAYLLDKRIFDTKT